MNIAPASPPQAGRAADAASIAAMLKADPAWVALAPASRAMALPDKVVLHAGPPIQKSIAAPIRNSAAMAVLFEGWADSEADAFAMIDRRAVDLQPAQDHRAVVPLAAVLTRSMLVHVVADRDQPDNRTFSPVNGGNGPAMRFGKSGPDVVAHLRYVNGELGALLKNALRHDIGLIDIANAALARGDDLHGRTPAATDLLCRALFGEAEPIAFLRQSPSMFLNLWMAACKCMTMAGSSVAGSSAVVACGGNGVEFGLKVAGLPDRWFCAPAEAPIGALESGFSPADSLGAIGDSAIVDAQGFGAMAMHCAPEQEKNLGRFMPRPSRELGHAVMAAADPRFLDGAAIRCGLAARHVAEAKVTPAISLGILDRAGRNGRIGGGVYVASREPFDAACRALQELN